MKAASPEIEQKSAVIYLKYGDYRPQKVVKVFPMTASSRAHSLWSDSSWTDNNLIVLAEFASKKVHSENTKTVPQDILYQPYIITTTVTLCNF